jgi:DNA replication protein DnaC
MSKRPTKAADQADHRYGSVDLILVDERDTFRRGAELLFQVLTERRERSAIAIASNEPSLPGQRHSPTRDCALRLLTG